MNSCLYRCEVMHHRLVPKEHRFSYNVFMFYLDLDELGRLNRKLRLFSRNRFNWFNFRDKDHLRFPAEAEGATYGKNVKLNVLAYLKSFNIDLKGGRIMLLTNVATLGYSFNPISFYLCFDGQKNPVCAVAEVCNTHGEMKLYLLNRDSFSEGTFRRFVPKLFYVSPFARLESSFDFIFGVPDERLQMRVDDYEDNKRFLLSSLTGKRRKLTDANLFWYGIRFPLITLKIMTLIFWQAFILYVKRIPFKPKNFNPHLQQDMYHYKKA
jgi:uncharacterized protein